MNRMRVWWDDRDGVVGDGPLLKTWEAPCSHIESRQSRLPSVIAAWC